jgi:hypothetical protein
MMLLQNVIDDFIHLDCIGDDDVLPRDDSPS